MDLRCLVALAILSDSSISQFTTATTYSTQQCFTQLQSRASPPEPTPKDIPTAQFVPAVKDTTKHVVEAVHHPPGALAAQVEPAAIEPEPLYS